MDQNNIFCSALMLKLTDGFKERLAFNIDPGTMNPVQHGEVFVTDDGAETDLDLVITKDLSMKA